MATSTTRKRTDGADDGTSATHAIDAVENIEAALLVEAIRRRWGFDFREYAPVSLKRRILYIVREDRLLRDESCMRRFLEQVTVSVTSIFRDPGFYRAFREIAVPLLREQRPLRIWHVGCASGEEVYSTAILLAEEGLLARTRLYATDINEAALEAAKAGTYSIEKSVEFPWPVAEVALQHHERIDGSGYPQGFKGEAILLEARILPVADMIEAMSSHRPYREALGIDKALAEIERGREPYMTRSSPMPASSCSGRETTSSPSRPESKYPGWRSRRARGSCARAGTGKPGYRSQRRSSRRPPDAAVIQYRVPWSIFRKALPR